MNNYTISILGYVMILKEVMSKIYGEMKVRMNVTLHIWSKKTKKQFI